MRWEDERYVRVYTRNTGEWLALSWEARALFVFLLRVADRAGLVHTGKAGIRGLAGLAGMPVDVVERVAPELLSDGCLRASEGGYVIPNFVAAQEARSSDAQRKRDQRERDRDKAIASGSTGSVTGLDAEVAMRSQRSVTQGGHAMESHDVTGGHAGEVTPSLAVPSRTHDLPDVADAASCGQGDLLDIPRPPKGPHPEALRDVWNNTAVPLGFQRWEAMSDTRKKAARLSLEAVPDVQRWRAWLEHELARPFNRGDNPSGWKADVDWLLRVKTRDLVRDFDPAVAAKSGKTPSGGDRPRLPPRESPSETTQPAAAPRRVVL